MNTLNCLRRSTCRLCGSKELKNVLSLTPTPPANAFVEKVFLGVRQETFPLDVFFCLSCYHVQLLDVVDPKLLFENYVYVSGTSPSFVAHFKEYADFLISESNPKESDLIVDIGSNDGTLLNFFVKAGHTVQGIDPAKEIANKATQKGIPTIAEFFSVNLANSILNEKGNAKIITANNMFAHTDDLDEVVNGIRILLSDDGIFSFEVSYLGDVYQKKLFDTIYHEHVAYHSIKPLVNFFRKHEMELIDVIKIASHGGSVRCVVQKCNGPRKIKSSVNKILEEESRMKLDLPQTFKKFGEDIDLLGKQLFNLLDSLKKRGEKVVGFGAPAKATTLMYHFGINPSQIAYIVDDSPLKQNLFTPGLHIPVLPTSALTNEKPDYILILAWNFAKDIISKMKHLDCRFIVPLPDFEII